MKPPILGAFWAFLYFGIAYGILTLLRVPKKWLFRIAILPPLLVGIVWAVWGFSYGGVWGGAIIALFLVFAGLMAWVIKRVML